MGYNGVKYNADRKVRLGQIGPLNYISKITEKNKNEKQKIIEAILTIKRINNDFVNYTNLLQYIQGT